MIETNIYALYKQFNYQIFFIFLLILQKISQNTFAVDFFRQRLSITYISNDI